MQEFILCLLHATSQYSPKAYNQQMLVRLFEEFQ